MRPSLSKKIFSPILLQLKQGSSPEKLALSCALGATLSLFPMIGATTGLCFLAGMGFRLNHPTLQVMNYAMTPLHLLFIPLAMRIGERLCGLSPVPFDPRVFGHLLFEHPLETFQIYGASVAAGILAWSIISAILGPILYYTLRHILRKRAGIVQLQ